MIKKLRNFFILQKGFTLIELTIVFTIIAIIGGTGFAAYSAYTSRQVLDSAAYDLKAGIDEAKSMAISRVKPSVCPASSVFHGYKLTVCVGGAGCQATSPPTLYEITPNCPPLTSPTATKSRNENVGMFLDGCSTPVITFSSQVGLTSGICRISMYNVQDPTGDSKTVCVDSGGNVSVKEGLVAC